MQGRVSRSLRWSATGCAHASHAAAPASATWLSVVAPDLDFGWPEAARHRSLWRLRAGLGRPVLPRGPQPIKVRTSPLLTYIAHKDHYGYIGKPWRMQLAPLRPNRQAPWARTVAVISPSPSRTWFPASTMPFQLAPLPQQRERGDKGRVREVVTVPMGRAGQAASPVTGPGGSPCPGSCQRAGRRRTAAGTVACGGQPIAV
jgi:hypothetical protein